MIYKLVSVSSEMPEVEGKYVVQTISSYNIIKLPPTIQFVETTMHITRNKQTNTEEKTFDLHRQIPIAWLKEIE